VERLRRAGEIGPERARRSRRCGRVYQADGREWTGVAQTRCDAAVEAAPRADADELSYQQTEVRAPAYRSVRLRILS
jgi:hypothetical protein